MKIISYLKQFLHFFNLSHELEKHETIHNEIQKGIIFKGTNLWILVFAILVASIGLNMNSTAVIIGAMLISPLMGPITGMGYSIAIYDGTLFSKSLKNFSFAVITSLLTSTLYFTLSPIATAHSELLARTSPTIYDVLIALFGGGAGIVALSSKQKGNVLPGVAIATALMPPLCTAGYGLATAQFHFFFGAFYLFLINTIFIALAATWVSKLFKFPISNVVDIKKKTKINRWLTFIISLILIPSIYFGYQLVKEERFKQNAEKFIDNVSFYEGRFLLKNEIKADKKWIKLVYAGNKLTEKQKQEITQKLSDFDLTGDLIIEQGFSLNADDSQNKEIYRLKEQLNNMNTLLNQKQLQLDSLQQNVIIGQSLVNEISVFFPDVRSCIVAHSKRYKPNYTESELQTIVVLELKSEITASDKVKIKKWLLERMKTDQIELIFK
ncbi:MAG: hypothetical protein H6Q25_110 [Bacteroidetes bacterium]|nr:hypothetical protein [Bacteroidota bacterium]